MENGLQRIGLSSITESGQDKKIYLPNKLVMEALDAFNQLRAFPMTIEEMLQWGETIEALHPNLDPLALCWLVDEMLAGRYQYDKGIGIGNILNGLDTVEKTGNTFRFKIDFPG